MTERRSGCPGKRLSRTATDGGGAQAPFRRTGLGLAAALLTVLVLTACAPEPESRDAGANPGISGIRYLSSTAGASDGFARALLPRAFVFPADHASHPAYRSEWWYFTGNVFDANEGHYGFELTLFRLALVPPGNARSSSLAADSVWMAHLALTDTGRQRFQAAERFSRGAPGIAGARLDSTGPEAGLSIRVEDFSILIAGGAATLRADAGAFGIALTLTGLDRIVAQGDGGLDAKGPEPGNASYYYSAPRLRVTGNVHSAGTPAVAVNGSAWMDREWGTSALGPDIDGWDWFALQLDDDRELMYYRLRQSDGNASPYSGGSLTDAGGRPQRLAAGDVAMTILRHWQSRASGVRYPVAWRLTIPSAGLDFEICPRIDGQELDLSVRYWEGAVVVCASTGEQPAGGMGYLELAGY